MAVKSTLYYHSHLFLMLLFMLFVVGVDVNVAIFADTC